MEISLEEKKALKVINTRTKRLLNELEIEKEDMSDEPKIAYLMQEIRANKTILNLIEKLQKENERLKTKIDICNCQEKSCREIIESKYIPKEKIKELIKRKKENIEGLHPASDCVLIDDFETQIDVLKQLLEENNYDE